MRPQLIMVVVVEAFDGRVLDNPVRPFDLAVDPRVIGLRQLVFDAICLANHVEARRAGVDGVPVPRLVCELDAVIGENGMNLVGHGFEHVLKELPGRLPIGLVDELGHGELARAVDPDEQIQLAFGSLHLCDVDMKEAYGVALELRPLRLVALIIRQARDAMPLQASMQRRSGQVGDGGLQRIKTVIQRQERVPSKRDDHRFLRLGQNRQAWLRRSGRHILDRRTLALLRNGLGIYAQFPAQVRERSLRSLYCCSDGVRGRGASVTNLSDRASFHSIERIAPSNRGIKHLGGPLLESHGRFPDLSVPTLPCRHD